MSIELPDMWPVGIGQLDQTITPAAVLKVAAAQLGEKTNQLVTGEVSSSISGTTVYDRFEIVVPALDHYRYRLFTVRHEITNIFPVIGDEPSKPDVLLEDLETFKEWLKHTLGSERTIKLVNSLLGQVRT